MGSVALLTLRSGVTHPHQKGMVLKGEGNDPQLGIVTSRKCPHCGHSEIGYHTPDGVFHPLKPGTQIMVMDAPEPLVHDTGYDLVFDDSATEEASGAGKFQPWVPPVLKGDQTLRAKYGVMMRESIAVRGPTGLEYRSAFLQKVEKLIEKQVHTPLPVILDRFFAAPHLASGSPRQVSQALWRELEEIRNPVLLVGDWLENQNEESLRRMIHPKSMEQLGKDPVSDNALAADLDSLTLEQFLELL